MTFQVTQKHIDAGPTQDAFLGPVNTAIREALKLHEGDTVIVRSAQIEIYTHGDFSKHNTPEAVCEFLELYDSEGNRGKALVSPFNFELDVA